jgi:UDP-glucose 4-epimerase
LEDHDRHDLGPLSPLVPGRGPSAGSPSASGPRVYNCASGIKITIRELAEKIIEAFEARVEPEYRDWRPGDIKYFDVSNAELSSLGFQFETGFDQCLRETIAWYRDYFAEHPPDS